MKHTIGFIGAGNMAEALISAIRSKYKILASDINIKRLKHISDKYKIEAIKNNRELVKLSDIVMVAVKPYDACSALEEVKAFFYRKKLLISIAAGVTIGKIEKYIKDSPIIRSMPNTPAMFGMGATAICRNSKAEKRHMDEAKKILGSCGIVVELKEKDFDAVTALSGSGPAYVFYVAENMIKASEKMGI